MCFIFVILQIAARKRLNYSIVVASIDCHLYRVVIQMYLDVYFILRYYKHRCNAKRHMCTISCYWGEGGAYYQRNLLVLKVPVYSTSSGRPRRRNKMENIIPRGG